MDTLWRIELLGGLRATRNDRVVTRFQTQKTGALLAYLAYHCQRAHPRETLIELLWPENEPRAGRNKLSLALSSLRHQFEPPGLPAGTVILASRAAVQLNPAAVTTDVAQFEAAIQAAAQARSGVEQVQRLTEAIELYHGELLPDYFEDWVFPERQRLAEAYLQALDELIAQLHQAGNLPRALQYARRAVSADPLREEAHHELIRLLAAAGQPEAALRQYQELERLLAQELSDAPAPETHALVQTIKDQRSRTSETSAPTLAPMPTPRSAAPAVPLTGTITFLLIERAPVPPGEQGMAGSASQAEWEQCSTQLRSLCQGHGGHEIPGALDALAVAFGRASDALAAAVAGMEYASRIPYSVSEGPPPGTQDEIPDTKYAQRNTLRMALHTGEAAPGEEAPQSPVIEHATLLLLAAHPSQILLSNETAGLLQRDLAPGVLLVDLGLYRLRDQAPPERLFQAHYLEMVRRDHPPPNALPAHQGHLPLQLTRFFGREEEIARLCEAIGCRLSAVGPAQAAFDLTDSRQPTADGPRLLTLTGPGGTGKTRLALEVAQHLRDFFLGAVWFVPLQDLMDARLIPEKLLDALRLPRSPHIQPLEQAVAFLSRQPSLLLLDNFEQLVTDGAPLVQSLLEQVPALTFLITSRQRLNLPGEQEFPVAPLPVPVGGPCLMVARPTKTDPSDPSDPSTMNDPPLTLMHCPSVQLFVDRAQAARPDFQITKTNAAVVAALCARLEGLPLALELAAARAGVLAPARILERLSQRFQLLATTQRGAAPRHRSLWAALEWSYQLLSPELQRFFARLSIFQGGCTLEAAEAICGEEGVQVFRRAGDQDDTPERPHPQAGTRRTPECLTLPALEQLRECSLVQAAEAGEEIRFRLLETLREYGAEQLGPEERRALAHRHASYFLALAERAEPELVRAEQVAWLDRLERDLDNLRAALGWLERSRETQAALRLGGALRRFWYVRGDLAEGLECLQGLLALPGAEGRTAARAKALNSAGILAWFQGDLGTSRHLHEESLILGRELGDRWNIAFSLTGLGRVLAELEPGNGADLEPARRLLEEGLTIWQEIDDPWGIVYALSGLGRVAYLQHDLERARTVWQECLRIRREQGDQRHVALLLNYLGVVARDQGDYEEAHSLFQEALALAEGMGDRRQISGTLGNLGRLAYFRGDLSTARALLEQNLSLAREMGGRQPAWALTILADVAGDQGDLDTATAYLEEAMSISVWVEDKRAGKVWSRRQQGRIALYRGDLGAARRCFAESLASAQAVGSKREIVNSLEGLAAVAADEGQPNRACRLFAAAAVLRESDGRPLAPIDHRRYEPHRAAVRAALGEEGFTAAWAAGRAMTPDEAVSVAVA